MDSPTRRRLLGAVTAVGTATVAGCVLDNPEVEGGHLFFENEMAESRRALLSVIDENTGVEIVHGEFRLPARTVGQYSGVLAEGNTYDIRVYQPAADESASLVTGASTCENEDDSQRRDVVVALTGDGPRVNVHACDSTYTTGEGLTYNEAPSEFRIGDVNGTVPG